MQFDIPFLIACILWYVLRRWNVKYRHSFMSIAMYRQTADEMLIDKDAVSEQKVKSWRIGEKILVSFGNRRILRTSL